MYPLCDRRIRILFIFCSGRWTRPEFGLPSMPMQSAIRQLLLTFLAAAMPLCCCQVGALATAFASKTSSAVSCCAKSCCEQASDASEGTQFGCCTGNDDPSPHHDCGGDCCKRVATNLSGPSWTDVHTLVADSPLPALLTMSSASQPADARSPRWETGPPPRPSGRDALTLHSVLVI